MAPPELIRLVRSAQSGDVAAFGQLVEATQAMAIGAATSVLRDGGLAQDAAQESFLRAHRRLGDLDDPAAFAGWLRRIVVSTALNMRRARRVTLLQLDDVPDVPVLDEAETQWTERQRRRLAKALLTLSTEDRRLCDRRYHGGWTTTRLAAEAGVPDTVMRKRLQRVRDKLRKEIEMAEQRALRPEEIRADFPARIVELLARPRLTDLPDNPVGKVLDVLRAVYADFTGIELPDVVDLADARRSVADDAVYIETHELQRVDERRILRYDLTLPLLLNVRFHGAPLRLWAAGKAYRVCEPDATHLDAFHQAEVFWVDERSRLDAWQVTARVLQSIDRLLPGRAVKIVPTQYAMCRQAWELEVEVDGTWSEVLAWGEFSDRIVRHLGADPARHTAIGVGHGLERLAMLKYGIDDIRKISIASVA